MSVSRQRIWQKKMVAEGRCQKCGQPRDHYASFCDECAIWFRKNMRIRQGTKAHKVTGRGRAPLVPE